MSSKKHTLSDKFASLINPAPAFDPDDDAAEDTSAKLIETFDDEDDDGKEFLVSDLRRKAANVNLEDKRYAGKKVSRKDLDQSSDDESVSGDNDEEEEESGNENFQNKEDGESEEISDDDNLMENQGQDESEDAEEEEEDDDEEGSEIDEDGDMFPDEEKEDNSAFKHFSKVDSTSDAQKGACVKNQLLIWDNLLEFRIQLQKTLKSANQMPLPSDFPKFKKDGGKEFESAQKKCASSVGGLIDKLVDLQAALFKQNPETKNIMSGKRLAKEENVDDDNEEIPSSDEEIESEEEEEIQVKTPPKKKRRLEDYEPLLSTTHKNFSSFRNTTIQKWSDKTRIAQGKFSSKNFSAFEQSTLKQIEHILADRNRLLKRTRMRRSNFRILGTETKDSNEEQKEGDDKSEDFCDEIFDDDDFYHQLLRELIEHKAEGVSDPVQLGRQWIALQKYRSKMKRKIDTRATKGRKIRYTVIPKLVNFMAPVEKGSWTNEAKDELFNSLFAA